MSFNKVFLVIAVVVILVALGMVVWLGVNLWKVIRASRKNNKHLRETKARNMIFMKK